MGKEAERHVHPFAPVYDARSQVLILGSFPSVLSRQQGFYYGNPRNRFWPLLEAVYAEPVPVDVPGRTRFLLEHCIALWDALAACEIRGSSDASVRGMTPNDLSLITGQAHIRRILANGRLAGDLCFRQLPPELQDLLVVLPSTSPANAAFSLGRLVERWSPHLQP